MSKQKKILYLGIVLALFIIVLAFPVYLFTSEMAVIYGVGLGLRVGYLVFLIIFSLLTKLGKQYTGRTNLKNLLLLTPIFFVAFTNIFYLGVVNRSEFSFQNPFADIISGLRFFSLIVTVVAEEWLFRYLIQKNLTFAHKIVRILVTAAIFAVTHLLLNIYSNFQNFNPIDLIDVVFLFGVGIILGILYEYTSNILVPLGFNMIYTLSNQSIFKVTLSSNPSPLYYVTVSVIIALAAGYLCLFYFVMLQKEDR